MAAGQREPATGALAPSAAGPLRGGGARRGRGAVADADAAGRRTEVTFLAVVLAVALAEVALLIWWLLR
jgi:hypothetical protein